MLRIELQTKLPAFLRDADAHVTEEVVGALIEAVNMTAKVVEQRLGERTVAVFHNPSPFTRNSFKTVQAQAQGSRDPAALVYIQDIQAKYLELEI